MSSNGISAQPSAASECQYGGSSSLSGDENADSQQDAWRSATESTLAKCSPDQKAILSQIRTSEAARAALLTVELQQRSRRSQMALGKIRRVLDAVKIFEDAMRVYSNAGLTELCLVWGSLTIVIQMASRAVSCFDKFLDLTVFLSENLHRTEGYAKLFRLNQRMQEVLKYLYGDFIGFCILSISFFRRKGIVMLWRMFWPGFERRLEGIGARMRSHQALVDVEASAATMTSTITADSDAREYRRMWLYRAVITWLEPTDVQTDYERLKIQRLKGLGDWLFEETCVKQWREGAFDILWINGIPGCGKTMLMSAFLDRLLDPGGGCEASSCTTYFFADANSVTRNCSVALLRSLAAQMLAQNPELGDVAYQIQVKSGQPRATSTTYLMRILQCLLDAKTKFSTVTVVIDALDECSDIEESGVLDFLLRLVGKFQRKLKLLLSSRAEPGLRDILKSYPKLSVTPEKTYTDIETYIRTTLKNTNIATFQEERLLSQITQKLTSKASGQFLWARLMLHELRKATFVREIDDIMNDLPAGLQKAYLRIFHRLTMEPRRRQDAARALFRWLACTERPLSLAELECALALRLGDQSLEPAAQMVNLQLLLDEVCGSLVEVVGGDESSVRFVHVTIKEFLVAPRHVWETENQALLQFHVDSNASHAYLASTCITQLCFPDVKQISIPEERHKIQTKCQLLSYASMFWATHLSKSGQPTHELLRQVLWFLDSKNMEAYLEWYSQQKTTAQSITLLQSQFTAWISQLSAGDPRVELTVNRFREHFEKTAESRAQCFGQNSPEHLESVHQLATLLHSAGAWEAAEKSARQCAQAREQLLGLDHPLTMESAFQLGTLLRRLGRVAEAATLHTTVLERRRKLLGVSHPDTLETEDELATTTNAVKTFEQVCKAERMSRETLLKKNRHYGNDHYRTAATINILASILKDKALALRASSQELLAVETLKECEELCLTCLHVRRMAFGEDHPEVSTSSNMLGIVTRHLGRLEESEGWHQKTLMARQKIFGPDNPHTQRSMRNLVNTFAEQFEIEKSERMRKRLTASLLTNPVLLRRASWSAYRSYVKEVQAEDSGNPRQFSVFKIDVVSLALRLQHRTAQIYMHIDESITFWTYITSIFWDFFGFKAAV